MDAIRLPGFTGPVPQPLLIRFIIAIIAYMPKLVNTGRSLFSGYLLIWILAAKALGIIRDRLSIIYSGYLFFSGGLMGIQDLKKYIPAVFFVFLLLAVLIRPDDVSGVISSVSSAAAPFVTGIILAAAAAPAVSRFEGFFGRRISPKAARRTAVAAVYLIAVGIITAAAFIILPKLWQSAALFVNSIDGYYSELRSGYRGGSRVVVELFDSLVESLSQLLPKLFDRTYRVTAEFLGGAASFLLGAVLSVYILLQREELTEFVSAAARSVLSEAAYKRSARVISAVNSCLVSFIAGQLTEAAVLGSLCFLGMVIFGFEYPLLISSIIAVTALVPVAGAIVGTVPSALILFLAKPSSAVWFIVFIIVLQQLENNFIYPKIVGKSVGLPPILILAAIILGARLGGAAGIMLGIPLVSAAYTIFRENVSEKLGEDQAGYSS